MNGLDGVKFRFLLVALLLTILAYPIVREVVPSHALFDGLVTAIFLIAAAILFTHRHFYLLVLTLGLPALTLRWINYTYTDLPPVTMIVAAHTFSALFLGFTVFTTVTMIYTMRTITFDGLCGTLSGYLLVGLAFGHIYCVIETLSPGSFLLHGLELEPVHAESHTHFLLAYFSLITLTTVGYGDILPHGAAARGFAVAEAVLGQFYMAVLIAELVGKRIAQNTLPNGAADSANDDEIPSRTR